MTTPKERMLRIFGFEIPIPGGSNEDERNEIFDEQEVAGIEVTKRGLDFIEVDCGCTDQRYGDFGGKLRIYTDGKLEVNCSCYPGCSLVNVHPMVFEKHAKTIGAGRWKKSVWVHVEGVKKSLEETNLLKYYLRVHPKRNMGRRGFVHPDEFMTCKKCEKKRRFECQTQHQCWLYHQAYLAKDHWTCMNHPGGRMNCETMIEREAKKKQARKCPKNVNCEGCLKCVCVDCTMCRFEDCPCRTCVDYILNAPPASSSNRIY